VSSTACARGEKEREWRKNILRADKTNLATGPHLSRFSFHLTPSLHHNKMPMGARRGGKNARIHFEKASSELQCCRFMFFSAPPPLYCLTWYFNFTGKCLQRRRNSLAGFNKLD
jgi:hypothetical protein